MSKQVGLDMVLYRNTNTFASPTWVIVENCRDLSAPDSFAEADVSIRGVAVKLRERTLRDFSFDFEMIYDPNDADYAAIAAAYAAKSLIEFALADGPIATGGTTYLRAQCKLFKSERSEPLEGANTRAFTAKPCYGANAISFVEV